MDFMVTGRNQVFYDYPDHDHGYWEILLNLSGTGTAYIGQEPYPFRPGTIFCIRPGVTHRKHSDDGFIDGGVLLRDFCFQNTRENVLVFQDDEKKSFETIYWLMFEFQHDPATDTYAERYLRSLVDAMQNLLSHWKDVKALNPQVARVQKIFLEHVGDFDFDLSTVLENTGYSPNHFRKLFREQCGCTPVQFFNQLKVQKAKQELLQHKTIMTISEIARSCGFQDPYYFSRMFKKLTGLSPMQYYKQSKKLDPDKLATDWEEGGK